MCIFILSDLLPRNSYSNIILYLFRKCSVFTLLRVKKILNVLFELRILKIFFIEELMFYQQFTSIFMYDFYIDNHLLIFFYKKYNSLISLCFLSSISAIFLFGFSRSLYFLFIPGVS